MEQNNKLRMGSLWAVKSDSISGTYILMLCCLGATDFRFVTLMEQSEFNGDTPSLSGNRWDSSIITSEEDLNEFINNYQLEPLNLEAKDILMLPSKAKKILYGTK